jgi:hypothetical protein
MKVLPTQWFQRVSVPSPPQNVPLRGDLAPDTPYFWTGFVGGLQVSHVSQGCYLLRAERFVWGGEIRLNALDHSAHGTEVVRVAAGDTLADIAKKLDEVRVPLPDRSGYLYARPTLQEDGTLRVQFYLRTHF